MKKLNIEFLVGKDMYKTDNVTSAYSNGSAIGQSKIKVYLDALAGVTYFRLKEGCKEVDGPDKILAYSLGKDYQTSIRKIKTLNRRSEEKLEEILPDKLNEEINVKLIHSLSHYFSHFTHDNAEDSTYFNEKEEVTYGRDRNLYPCADFDKSIRSILKY
jgi:hypothetical protein